MSDKDNFTGNPFADDDDNFKGDPFAQAPAAQQPAAPLSAKQMLEQHMGPSDFTKSFASTPARMLKSAMQMAGAGDYVPEWVSEKAAEGDKSVAGRIAGDVAGTGGIRSAGVGLAQTLAKINAAKGIIPALGRVAEGTTYGGAQGALTTPDNQSEAAKWGFVGGGVMPAAGNVMRAAGHALPHVLGVTTGAGAEPVRQAFKNAPGFVENMRGSVEPGTVVDAARQGVHNMRQQMYSRYATAKGGWAGDTTPLDFRPIGQAYNDAAAKFSFKGTPQPGVAGVKQQTEAVLNDWLAKAQKDPAFLTVEGLDALKRHLSTITPTDVTNRAGRAFVSEVTDSIKKSIIAQRPEYAEAMEAYSKSMSQLDEIERSLSLGDRNTVDTALRKLQSLMRNNVNSNFGQRVQSAQALEQVGADVMGPVAGQALNSWTPRGLQGAVAGGAGVPSAILAPKALLAAPAMSPRLVGEAARYSGMVINDPRTQMFLQALRRGAAPTATAVGDE